MASGQAQDKIKRGCPGCPEGLSSCPEFCPEKIQQNQWVIRTQDKLRTDLGQNRVTIRSVRTTTPPLEGGCPDLKTCPNKWKDYSLLAEKEFQTLLEKITCLAELEGLANRRKILNAPQLTRWNESQRQMLITRKLELQNSKKGKRK